MSKRARKLKRNRLSETKKSQDHPNWIEAIHGHFHITEPAHRQFLCIVIEGASRSSKCVVHNHLNCNKIDGTTTIPNGLSTFDRIPFTIACIFRLYRFSGGFSSVLGILIILQSSPYLLLYECARYLGVHGRQTVKHRFNENALCDVVWILPMVHGYLHITRENRSVEITDSRLLSIQHVFYMHMDCW